MLATLCSAIEDESRKKETEVPPALFSILLHHRRPLRQLMVAEHIIREAVDHHALSAGSGCAHFLAAVQQVGMPEQHIAGLRK